MVAKSYIRLIAVSVIIFFNNTYLKSMDDVNFEMNVNEAYSLYKESNLIIIDVRTVREWQMTGVIPNSILANMHDENNLERKDFLNEVNEILLLNKDKKIGFICASGARSKIVLDFFLEQGIKNIYHIPEGITGRSSEGWLFQGYPITNFSTKKD